MIQEFLLKEENYRHSGIAMNWISLQLYAIVIFDAQLKATPGNSYPIMNPRTGQTPDSYAGPDKRKTNARIFFR
jgi:hypothetical protein